MIEKFEYVTKYVFRERGVTFHPPYKNCVLAISIRGKNEHEEDRDGNYTNQDMNHHR